MLMSSQESTDYENEPLTPEHHLAMTASVDFPWDQNDDYLPFDDVDSSVCDDVSDSYPYARTNLRADSATILQDLILDDLNDTETTWSGANCGDVDWFSDTDDSLEDAVPLDIDYDQIYDDDVHDVFL